MATQLQSRRGTTAQMNAFTGAEGEIAVNTSTDTLHVHDGSTAGGHALAKADGSNIATYAGSFTTISASGAITGNVTGNLTGSVLTAAQTNITSLGTLSALTVSGAVTATGLTVNGVSKLKAGSTSTPADTAAFISNAAAKLVVNHGNEYGAYIGYANSSTDAVGIQSTTSGGTTGPLLLNPYGSNVIIGGSTAGDAAADNLTLVDSGNAGMTIQAGDTSYASIYFKDSASPNPGYIQYKQGDDFMRFATGGSEAMRLSGGNLLVGTTSNSVYNDASGTGIALNAGQIQIAGTGVPLYLNRQGSDGTIAEFRKSGTAVGKLGVASGNNLTVGGSVASHAGLEFGTNRITPQVAGSTVDAVVDLGYSTQRFQDLFMSGKLHINNDIIMKQTNGRIDYDNGVSSGALRFFSVSGNAERMRIDSGGALRINGSTGYFGEKFTVTSSTSYTQTSVRTGTGSEGHVAFRNANGAVGTIFTNGTTTSYNTSSDQRLKENIADADDAGAKIDAIQVRKFDWKVDGSHQDYGMVAQELLEVAPEAVSAPEDPEEMMGVDYSKLVPMLVKEIQSLRSRVAELENN